ncbi:MAG TPA: TadE family type IV pilus minor pilin [Jiangellales bacterium]|nr:TadE family type IV pilus minor pilin [Jiangellales bacterium]
MVTAETAAAVPALLVLLVALVWGVSAASAQLRCTDAAREAARALARGDALSTSREVALAVAPDGARVTVAEERDMVRVRVEAAVPLPRPLSGRLPGLVLRGEAATPREGP